MQFGVLVDRTIDGEQKVVLAQRIEVLVQIAIAALRPRNGARALDVSGLASGHLFASVPRLM
jgi:phage baseplate assembly protein W